jgi:hypothetical protein
MKRVKGLAVACVVFLAIVPSPAAQDQRQAAEELMTLTQVEALLADVRSQVGQMMTSQLKAMTVHESDQAKVASIEKKIHDRVAEELSFAKMKEGYISTYTTVFTAAELDALVTFFRTPAGRAFMSKLPELQGRMMQQAQERVMALTPEVKKMIEEAGVTP